LEVRRTVRFYLPFALGEKWVAGGMQMNALRRSSIISDVAGDAGLAYEQVEPVTDSSRAVSFSVPLGGAVFSPKEN